eukprot:1632837-Pyramimonas_sp.AAC.1
MASDICYDSWIQSAEGRMLQGVLHMNAGSARSGDTGRPSGMLGWRWEPTWVRQHPQLYVTLPK